MCDLQPGEVSVGMCMGCVGSIAHPCYHSLLSRCLGIENKKGSLRPGADADLVVLDRQGKVLSTWVKGKKVWEKN